MINKILKEFDEKFLYEEAYPEPKGEIKRRVADFLRQKLEEYREEIKKEMEKECKLQFDRGWKEAVKFFKYHNK
jgi:hypothetical protein